jgi:hypothetical protein
MLNLVAHVADDIASGGSGDPERLAGYIRQVAWSLADTISEAVDELETAERLGLPS